MTKEISTDAELMSRLLATRPTPAECLVAAARIEQLAASLTAAEAERDEWQARAERLAAALVEHNDLLRSALAIAKREGVEGRIASTNWDAYYNRVAVVLKRHHRTANEARAALTTEKTHE